MSDVKPTKVSNNEAEMCNLDVQTVGPFIKGSGNCWGCNSLQEAPFSDLSAQQTHREINVSIDQHKPQSVCGSPCFQKIISCSSYIYVLCKIKGTGECKVAGTLSSLWTCLISSVVLCEMSPVKCEMVSCLQMCTCKCVFKRPYSRDCPILPFHFKPANGR